MAAAEHFLDRYLDPVREARTSHNESSSGRRKLPDALRSSARRTLTEAEGDEYRSLADAGTLVALLKAKARRVLARHRN